jgi:hypothetical protein
VERKRATWLEGLDTCRTQIESSAGALGVVVLVVSVARATWWRIVGIPAERLSDQVQRLEPD